MTDTHITCQYCGTDAYEDEANETGIHYHKIPDELEPGAQNGHVCDLCLEQNDWVLTTAVGLWAWMLNAQQQTPE